CGLSADQNATVLPGSILVALVIVPHSLEVVLRLHTDQVERCHSDPELGMTRNGFKDLIAGERRVQEETEFVLHAKFPAVLGQQEKMIVVNPDQVFRLGNPKHLVCKETVDALIAL